MQVRRGSMALRKMPGPVRSLRRTWKSLVSAVPNLTRDLELDFRFGQRITRTDGGYVMGGTMKGGSSSMWYPVSRVEYEAYRRWRNEEGIQEARDDEAYERLRGLLEGRGVELATRRYASPTRRKEPDGEPFAGYGPLYRDMESVLRGLPEGHLGRPELSSIELGGWGPDAAKASAYVDGAVLMYDFACRGARRTFLGLFLHELGHAHETALGSAERGELQEAYGVLAEHDAFIGVEFLMDPDTRKLYQKFVFNEFLAETYMIYVACGKSLRRTIEGAPEPVRGAWQGVYEVFRRTFDGVEYE